MANVTKLLDEFNAIGVTDVSDGNFFLNISRKIDILLNTFIYDVFQAYAVEITLLMSSIIALFIVATAFRLLKGDLEGDWVKLSWKFGYPGIIFVVVTSYAVFYQGIVSIVQALPNEFGSIALKATNAAPMGVTDPLHAMSIFFKKSLKAIDIILAVGDGWLKYAFVLLMFIVVCAIAIPILSTLLIAKVGTAVFLGMASIFLVFSIFETTKGIFEAWVRALLGFAVMLLLAHVLIALVMSLMHVTMMDMAVGFNGGKVGFSTLGAYFFLGGCSYFIVNEAQGLAKGLAGGYVMSTFAAGKASSSAMKNGATSAWNNRGRIRNTVNKVLSVDD